MDTVFNETFWAFIALVLFLGLLAYLKVPAWVGRNLDSRAQRIYDELEEARRLREEAQQLLAEYQRKRELAEKEAEDIILTAKREAELLARDARKKIEDFVARRNKMAEQKIAFAEAEAVNTVRNTAVDLAVAAAGQVIHNKLDKKGADTLFDVSIREIKTRLN